MNKEQEKRMNNVNELVRVIANCGRYFFRHVDKESQEKTVGCFKSGLKTGRLYWFDEFKKKCLPMGRTDSQKWRHNFSNGGTLKALIILLAGHIRTGKPITAIYSSSGGNISWGYDEASRTKVNDFAIEKGIYVNENDKVLR